MWLDELQGLVAELAERINRHRDTLAKSESTTRYALIDPLLSKIGWCLADPDQVLTEYSIPGSGRLDYAMWHQRRLCLVVEAKKLGEGLEVDDKATDQALRYCYREGCDHFVVTNGDEWKAYYLRGKGRLQDNQTLDFRVTTGPSIMELFWLWPGNFEGVAARPKFHKPTPRPIDDDPSRRHEEPTTKLSGTGTPLPEVTYEKGRPAPSLLVFPDGETKDVAKGWTTILHATVEWLVDHGKVEAGPLRTPQGRILLNTSPINTKGNAFANPKQVGDYHFEGNVSPRRALDRTAKILEACAVSPEKIQLIL